MTSFRPSDAAEVAELVTWAVAGSHSLEIVAGGSKRGLGRPSEAAHTLDLSALSGIIEYDAPELVLTARAATPMAEIEALLTEHRQMLAFEPPDWRALMNSDAEPTLGGVVACNLAGPRRVRAGAARDHFLGFAAVNGRGDAWKAGGKVVKNVTGYDMCKLQAGAYGTLSVLTEISLRVLPRPQTSCSVVLLGLTEEAAIPALSDALNTAHEVSAAAHLPAELAARSAVAAIAQSGAAATVMRLEGPHPSVVHRAGALMAGSADAIRLDESQSTALWREIGAVQPLLAGSESIVWRVCTTPSTAPDLVRQVRRLCPSTAALYDWGGGLLWMALDAVQAGADCGAALLRGNLQGGHATLIRAPAARRWTVDVFEPAAPALDALSRRVKASFDPLHPQSRPHAARDLAMQTSFSAAQLADPGTAEAAKIIRTCVHCGFCTSTCPTYTLLGDELDSPRGRIYMIKDMLENDRPATAQVVKHVDRCLSCLSCMTTCPSGVNYMHLVDHARHHIERTFVRPWPDRLVRRLLAAVLPNTGLFRAALLAARLGKPAARLLPSKLRVMLTLAPARLPRASAADRPQSFPALGKRLRRVALLSGCAQRVLAPQINDATIRLLTRHGCEVVVAKGAGCCGALAHHLGRDGHAAARANILAWTGEMQRKGGLDAIVINASGCGTTVKDYGFMFRDDPELREPARIVSTLARDITELMSEIGLMPPKVETGQRVAYHSACSLQHGQQVRAQPKILLRQAGFEVVDVPEGHLCCGSAGTYNLLQPEIATQLRDRKVANIEATAPTMIAAGNIGCMTQIGAGTSLPVLHTAELLDWATGGPRPSNLPV